MLVFALMLMLAYDHVFACACVTSENKALLAVDSRRTLKETLIAEVTISVKFSPV